MNYVNHGINDGVIGHGTIRRGEFDFEDNNILYYVFMIILIICICFGIYHYRSYISL